MEAELEHCTGCGALVPKTDGPAHEYLGASPGCWAVFGEVLTREYEDYRYWPVHQLTVDAYAVQHPGEPAPQTVRSTALHLIRLYLQIERGESPGTATAAMQRAARHREGFVWLTPPASLGEVTVLDVRRAGGAGEHAELVWEWGSSAWKAWAEHHETVRRWAALQRS